MVMNGLVIMIIAMATTKTIIIIKIIIITVIVIIVLVIIIMIIRLWLSCLGEIFDMSKDDHVVENKDGAPNRKAKQYFGSISDEDVQLSGKYLGR